MTRFKVAYIHPAPHGGVAGSTIPVDGFQNQPAGLTGALNALVREDVELIGLNVAIELRLDRSFSLADWIARSAPDLVLIELHWYLHAHGSLHAAAVSKSVAPELPVVMGGLTATAFAPEILRRWPEVDMILEGEADRPLSELVSHMRAGKAPDDVPNLWRRCGREIVPPARRWSAATLDGLDHVDLSWLVHRAEFQKSDFPYRNQWLLMGRGCPNACFFCGGSSPSLALSFGRSHQLIRPPEQLAADIVRLAKAGIQGVNLTHDIFSMGRAYWEPLFAAVRRSGVTVGLGNESWGPVPDDDVLEAWARTFDVSCSYIALSPTSAWSGLAALAHKPADADALFRSLETLARHRFPLHVFFLWNLPGETIRMFEHTMDLAALIVRRYPGELLRLETQTAPIDPRSPAALGLTKGFVFRSPTLDDYLAVSSGEDVEPLNWPVGNVAVDPGDPSRFDRVTPRDIMALAAKCPSFMDRWRDLLRLDHIDALHAEAGRAAAGDGHTG